LKRRIYAIFHASQGMIRCVEMGNINENESLDLFLKYELNSKGEYSSISESSANINIVILLIQMLQSSIIYLSANIIVPDSQPINLNQELDKTCLVIQSVIRRVNLQTQSL
jgi:hypothetical protein